MRIVIAGASGFVGQMLVPELRARGADVMLLGRTPEALHAKFPDCAVSDYANLSQALRLAQVAGVDISDPARLVAWDALYTALRGLILDIRLILQTSLGARQGDRVVK